MKQPIMIGDHVVTVRGNKEGIVRKISGGTLSVQHFSGMVDYVSDELKHQTFGNFIAHGFGNMGWTFGVFIHAACVAGSVLCVVWGAPWLIGFMAAILGVVWFGQWKQYTGKWV